MQRIRVEKLNPVLKAITVLISAILISFQYITILNTLIFVLCLLALLFFSNVKFKNFIYIFIPALMAAFGIFLLGLYYAKGNSITQNLSLLSHEPYAVRAMLIANFGTALSLATRLLAYSGLGIFFALTTDGEEFIASLVHQCKLTPRFAYGIIAAVNIMPHMLNELKTVRLACKVRGLKVNLFSSRVLFIMLVNSVRWSESLALAMESKGFTGNSDRTYYSVTQIKFYDVLFVIGTLSLIIVGMFLLSDS